MLFVGRCVTFDQGSVGRKAEGKGVREEEGNEEGVHGHFFGPCKATSAEEDGRVIHKQSQIGTGLLGQIYVPLLSKRSRWW